MDKSAVDKGAVDKGANEYQPGNTVTEIGPWRVVEYVSHGQFESDLNTRWLQGQDLHSWKAHRAGFTVIYWAGKGGAYGNKRVESDGNRA